MGLSNILPADKAVKMPVKDFKRLARECRNGKRKVTRMLKIKRMDFEDLESKNRLNNNERHEHQKLGARIIELGQEEAAFNLQLQELEKAILNWFI